MEPIQYTYYINPEKITEAITKLRAAYPSAIRVNKEHRPKHAWWCWAITPPMTKDLDDCWYLPRRDKEDFYRIDFWGLAIDKIILEQMLRGLT